MFIDSNSFVELAKNINNDVQKLIKPPEEGARSPTEKVIYFSLVRETRQYIEKIVHQINGAYDKGWYDASGVMIRRLIETLIIECFEAQRIPSKIKNSNGDFLYLKQLITATLNESSWSISRNTKRSLRNLKDIGDKSAHSRRFLAHRQDIDKIIPDLRTTVQELILLARLK